MQNSQSASGQNWAITVRLSPYLRSAQSILVSSGCEQLVTEVPEIHFSAFEEWDYALET